VDLRDSDSFFENGMESGREREEIRVGLLFSSRDFVKQNQFVTCATCRGCMGNCGTNEAFKSWFFMEAVS
jgi:hypothetical protein